MKTKIYIFYGLILSIVIIAKIAYTQATNDTLVFILKPLSTLVSYILNSDFIYTNASGFYFESLNITIDKSCSGINFWIISFTLFSVSILNVIRTNLWRSVSIIGVLIASFIFTLFANTSRILTAVFLSNQVEKNYTWLHQAEGVFIYVTLLILAYSVFNHFISKYQNKYAQLT